MKVLPCTHKSGCPVNYPLKLEQFATDDVGPRGCDCESVLRDARANLSLKTPRKSWARKTHLGDAAFVLLLKTKASPAPPMACVISAVWRRDPHRQGATHFPAAELAVDVRFLCLAIFGLTPQKKRLEVKVVAIHPPTLPPTRGVATLGRETIFRLGLRSDSPAIPLSHSGRQSAVEGSRMQDAK